jgi:hypothetical protein
VIAGYSAFIYRLKREIKFSLFSTKRESPEVRIELPIDQDVFERFEHSGRKMYRRGKWVYVVDRISDLHNVILYYIL